jgi:hypothetical protein
VNVTLGVWLIMVHVVVPTVRVVRIHPAIGAQPADREVLHVRFEAGFAFQLRSQFIQIMGRKVNGSAAVLTDHVVVPRYGIRVFVMRDSLQHDLVHQVQVVKQTYRPVNGRLVDRGVLLYHALVEALHGDVTAQLVDRLEDQDSLRRQPVTGSLEEVDRRLMRRLMRCSVIHHANCDYSQ